MIKILIKKSMMFLNTIIIADIVDYNNGDIDKVIKI